MPIRRSRIRYLNKLNRSLIKETKFAVSYGEAGFSINAGTLAYMAYLKSPEAIKLLSERVPYNNTRDALNPHDSYYYPINVLSARAGSIDVCHFWVTRDDPCLIEAIEHQQSMAIAPGHPKSDIVIEKIRVLPDEKIFRRFVNPPDSREYIVIGTPDEIIRS